MKHKLLLISLAIVLAVSVGFVGCGGEQEEELPEIEVKFASVAPAPPNMLSDGHDYLQQRVTELSDGKITWDNYYSGALLGVGDLLEGCQTGVADIVMGLPIMYPSKTAINAFPFAFPFKPSSIELVYNITKQMFGMIPALHQELADYNMMILMMQGSGDYDVNSVMNITSLADMEGKKLAAVGTYFPAWVAASNATAVAMPGAERYEALKYGTIDGQVIDIFTIVSDKHYEVATCYLDTDLGANVGIFLWVNLDFWNSLPSEYQEMFEQAAEEAEAWHLEQLLTKEEEYREFLEDDEGLTFHQMSTVDKETWAAAMPDSPSDFAWDMEALGKPGWNITDTYIQLFEDAGYVWPREFGVP